MSLVCGAAEYIVKIPEAFWGPVVGAGIALLGVWGSNRFSRGQLKLQLAAAESQRANDRRMETREKVFLEAATWSAKAFERLGKFARLDEEEPSSESPEAAHLTSPSRVQIVANDVTHAAFLKFGAELTEALSLLTTLRFNAQTARTAMQALKGPVRDESDFAYATRRTATVGAFENAYSTLIDVLLNRVEALSRLDVMFAIAMRRELGFNVDEEAFMASSMKVVSDQRKALEAWVRKTMGGP
jgi:hypothetical protein